MRRDAWNQRYAGAELVWSLEPNRFVAHEVADLPPGRALDVACGEGRNAIWLAKRGWDVVAVDFSSVGLDKARRLADAAGVSVAWREADVTVWDPPGEFDFVVVSYLQLAQPDLEAVFARIVPAVAAGGTILVVGHDTRNLDEGVGGPPDPAVLLDVPGVVALLGDLEIERAEVVERPVEGADRPALDTLVRARRPRAGDTGRTAG
jgi:SAM-dependent methyltransferase